MVLKQPWHRNLIINLWKLYNFRTLKLHNFPLIKEIFWSSCKMLGAVRSAIETH